MTRATRERILDASLALFNARGEAKVSTNHIADDLGISPGNLYHHFRNKGDIVEHLFAHYEARIDDALQLPDAGVDVLGALCKRLALVLETNDRFRFLQQDLAGVVARHRIVRLRFPRLGARITHDIAASIRALRATGALRIGPDDLDVLAGNMQLVTMFWSASRVLHAKEGSGDGDADLGRGLRHVMLLAAPHLGDAARDRLHGMLAPDATP